jgi:DNA sulfur modification protein DndD
MIINKVVINNFFCYLGENTIEFSKGLNIVSAKNGGGKSQLFNTFYWTFFDSVYVDKDGSSGKKEWKQATGVIVCPDKLVVESENDKEITCSVEITLSTFFHENDDINGEVVDYTFLKSVVYKKVGSRLVAKARPELIISYQRHGETEFIPTHQHSYFLDRIFPASIRKFMWFQGETMDNLYDFSNSITLRNAINEISYYPMYDVMEKMVIASSKSIDEKVEKVLTKQNRLSVQQQTIYREISAKIGSIESKESQIDKLKGEISSLEEDIVNVEEKLKGYDEFIRIKEEMLKYESEIELAKTLIENIDVNIKETLINKWMLNGCDSIIDESKNNLELLNKQIQENQKNTNPIPVSLPGPEYVEKMIADNRCYICERDVEENSASFEALKRRLNDFEISQNNRILQDNYTDLNRARGRLTRDLPGIQEEIKAKNEEKNSYIKKRNNASKKLRAILESSGQEHRDAILIGGNTASQHVSKLNTLRNQVSNKSRTLTYLQNEILGLKESLRDLESKKDEAVKGAVSDLVESKAADYIKMFVKSIGKLRSIAYEKLIDEIQRESNRLYSLYLGGKQQGKIVIDNGIRIIDERTEEILTNLNTGEIVAQKLAVANSFLSLSSQKMNRSYPLIADAPTSDLDGENTYNLTLNIGNSFEQIIIMSKDYATLSEAKIRDLISTAHISSFYNISNEKIDLGGDNSRVNTKSNITRLN